MKPLLRSGIIFTLFTIVGLNCAAHAQSYYVRNNIVLEAGTVFGVGNDTGNLLGQSHTYQTFSVADSGASATAMTQSDLGTLKAFVSASGGTFLDNDGNPHPSGSNQIAEVRWFDTLTVTSTTLPAGSPIDLLLTLDLDGGFTSTDPSILSRLQASINTSIDLHGSTQLILSRTQRNAFSKVHLQGTYHSQVGEVLTLTQNLQILGTVVGAVGGINGAYTADFFHTGHGYVDVITPGASYITSSGQNYTTASSAAPEPSSLLILMFSGIFAKSLVRKSNNVEK